MAGQLHPRQTAPGRGEGDADDPRAGDAPSPAGGDLPADEAAAAIEPQSAGGHLPEWMTIREICYETQLGQAYVRRQIQTGELPHAVFGTRIRVRRVDYEDWARRRQDATATSTPATHSPGA